MSNTAGDIKPADIPNVPARQVGHDIHVSPIGAGGMLRFETMKDVIEFGQIMCKAGPAIPPAFRENPGMCVAVAMQAMRWQADPFAVAAKAYVTTSKGGDARLAYEAQLIAAIVNTRAPVKERPRVRYEGEGGKRKAFITATLMGEDQAREVETPIIDKIHPKNSPLWTSDPDQQLAYYGLRAWARRVCPEILLGIYTPEEVEAGFGPDNARDVTPAERPQRKDYDRPKAADSPPAPIVEHPKPEPTSIDENVLDVRDARDGDNDEHTAQDQATAADGPIDVEEEPLDPDAFTEDFIGWMQGVGSKEEFYAIKETHDETIEALPKMNKDRCYEAMFKTLERLDKATGDAKAAEGEKK